MDLNWQWVCKRHLVGNCSHGGFMFPLFSKVRHSRAGGGGQEAIRGSEDRQTGDQGEKRRSCFSSLQPR